MSNWDEPPSAFDRPALTTQYSYLSCSICAKYPLSSRVPVKGGTAWPKVIGIIGIIILTVCAFVLPAAIIVATTAGMFLLSKKELNHLF